MQLVEASSSLLSPVGGQERFLTLSSSHVTAFMKAVMSGSCCTLEPGLQEVNGGRLTEDAIATFYQDEAFNQCAKQGWLWKVLASEVEAELEWIPGFFQGAMNTLLLGGMAKVAKLKMQWPKQRLLCHCLPDTSRPLLNGL